jgi:formate-dependent nitrite reductase cytochrome c552 subunit
VACENCHSDSISGDGAVPKQVCWNCHNQPAQIARYSETTMMHREHVTEHKVECASCHVQIQHSLYAGRPGGSATVAESHLLENEGSCGACHEKTHLGPLEMYAGAGGIGVDDMPSPMYRTQVDCIACHRKPGLNATDAALTGQSFRTTQESCDNCHGNHYPDRLEQWKATIEDHQLRADAARVVAAAALTAADIDEVQRLKLRRLLDDADHNIRFVKLGHGAHNVTYATALLNVSMDKCRQILTALNMNPDANTQTKASVEKSP